MRMYPSMFALSLLSFPFLTGLHKDSICLKWKKVAPALVACPTSATHTEKPEARQRALCLHVSGDINTKMLSGTKVKRLHISAAQKGHSSAGDLGQAPAHGQRKWQAD